MKISIVRVITLSLLYLSLSACGNKGDLYIPKKEEPAKTTEKDPK